MNVTHTTSSDASMNAAGSAAWNEAHTLDYDISVNAQTGTTYTLQASDNGKAVTFNNGSAIALTVPSGLGAGFNCLLVQLGAGAVTATGSGATVNSRGGLVATNGQYAVASLVAYVANTFVLAGDLA